MKPILILLLSLLTACAAPLPDAPVVAPPAASPAALTSALAALPGAELLDTDEIGIRYPGEVLFSSGAVLPLPGGVGLLDPLARFLVDYPGNRWALKVRAETEFGEEYDQRLAEGRAELLKRYLLRRGVAPGQLDWQIEAGAGAPLEVLSLDPPLSGGRS
ncbi:hypothetical protein SAMN05660860_01305 [Geoalkalibacter ferrihydriticus]|uniref:OmpA-like domain-containing protein n=2 Tax=Geoalkalibacter ferrihydriticus TaxID=392333 RepID=A0A0C2EGM7_9BACT|nr:hypothetical protein [Geoalkalibacter ferrihydriticus]KIH77798.1 hypothetical protein GFER_03935 [Geoalkalibacter ferrihydriticus DSM 17813]SDL79767.1 hypothetical protein SAMN05660860_01305 [Geoalkalibacter ferrihydriticus]